MPSTNETPNDHWLVKNSTDSAAVARYYDDWASRYDHEIGAWGYESPRVVARLLADRAGPTARVLDAGCGTGLSGQALHEAGFEHVVGIDISADSLRIAAALDVYEQLQQVDMQSLPMPFEDNAFDALVCVGVVTYIADTAGMIGEWCRLVKPGGHVVFTCRDDLYGERGYPSLFEAFSGSGRLRLLHQSTPSAYLPGNEDFAQRIRVIYVIFEVV